MSAAFPLADLIVRIVGDMSQFSREMVRTESLLKKKAAAFTALESQGKAVMNALGRAATGFGNVLAISATAALGSLAALTGGLAAFSVWAVKVGTGADELRNRFKVTFGTEAAKAKAELSDFADVVGRSRLDLLDMAATLQNVFTAMGFSIAQSAKLSTTVAKLGTDIASFHDIADTDAVDRLSSALVGNHEALRSLGIVVTEGAVKQQLLQMGFKGASDSASDQQKILARLAIIVKDTTLMHNDAANTASSMSNQFKGLWGVIKDLADMWGSALTPALKVIVDALRDLALSARDNTGSFQQLSAMMVGWANSVVNIFSELTFVIANYDLSWKALVMTIQQAIEPIHTTIASWAVGLFSVMEWLGTNWQIIWQNTVSGMLSIFSGFVNDVKTNLTGLWDYIASGGTKGKFTTMGTRALNEIMEGTTNFTMPEIDSTDWDQKWRELENEFDARRNKIEKGHVPSFKPFEAPDINSMFSGLQNAKMPELKVSLADSASAWKDNLKEAFKDSHMAKQVKLQETIVQNQDKQIVADKQNTDALTNALANSGGGFY